jgi:hypothetical protein
VKDGECFKAFACSSTRGGGFSLSDRPKNLDKAEANAASLVLCNNTIHKQRNRHSAKTPFVKQHRKIESL